MPTLIMASENMWSIWILWINNDLLFCSMSVASSLFVDCSICYLFLRAVMHTHLYRHIHTDAGDLAHFDVTDRKKDGVVESNNFKDEVDRIEALDPSPFLPFFSILISLPLFSLSHKVFLMKRDNEREAIKKGKEDYWGVKMKQVVKRVKGQQR